MPCCARCARSVIYALLSTPLLQCGVGCLARSLNQLLVEHIRGALPALRGRVEAAAAVRQAELAILGDAPPGSSSAARCVL